MNPLSTGAGAPEPEVLSPSAEARRATQAKLAELEILHHDKLAKLEDFTQREEQEEYFRRERERITADGERAVAKLRESS